LRRRMQSMAALSPPFSSLLGALRCALFCSIAADRHAAPPPLTAVIQVLPMMLNGLQ
jgi:hypothetical protein